MVLFVTFGMKRRLDFRSEWLMVLPTPGRFPESWQICDIYFYKKAFAVYHLSFFLQDFPIHSNKLHLGLIMRYKIIIPAKPIKEEEIPT